MRERGLWIAVLILSTVAIVLLLVGTRPILAQGQAQHADKENGASSYNPYPPGILPSNLSSEVARVLREVDVIESRALARWHGLEPPTLAGQPPILQNTGTEAIETLGELMLYDKNISPDRNEACASCHMPYAGFSGPIPSVNLTMIAYPGTAHFRAGKRVAQRHPYSPFFPVLQYNQVQGLFFGGNFWDSRATGYKLRVPDAEQAQGPPVDTQEMGFPSTITERERISRWRRTRPYRDPFSRQKWGQSWPCRRSVDCTTATNDGLPKRVGIYGAMRWVSSALKSVSELRPIAEARTRKCRSPNSIRSANCLSFAVRGEMTFAIDSTEFTLGTTTTSRAHMVVPATLRPSATRLQQV